MGGQGEYFSHECNWGNFYRRIILPESVDINKAEAKNQKNGVLIVILPLLKNIRKR